MHKPLWLLGAAFCASSVFASTSIDLSTKPSSYLANLLFKTHAASSDKESFQTMKSSIDFNKTIHLRMQETYQNYLVWGADFVVHIKQNNKKQSLKQTLTQDSKDVSMDGIIYKDLEKDLQQAPSYIFQKSQAEKVLHESIMTFNRNSKYDSNVITNKKASLIIYVDENNKAHWAYLISFQVEPKNSRILKLRYIVDAINSHIYENWDDVKTLSNVPGGGNGGNLKIGKFSYDGLTNNLPKLDMQRDDVKKVCYLQNLEVTVKDLAKKSKVSQFSCVNPDPNHNNVYWDGTFDTVNGAYSPGNDALYFGKVIKNLYADWYKIPVLVDASGKPMMLVMRVHDRGPYSENAYWDGSQMTFGDGGSTFYPFVSLGVAAHEISHGFTEQHSNFTGNGQAGGMNESFSDMASAATEFYTTGKNNWKLGDDIIKQTGDVALRYMDRPSKDCNGGQPGNDCSIDNASQYKSGLDVHYSCGVYNRLFYLLATSSNWNTHKAFDVMVQANSHYWTTRATFKTAACGVVKATRDYKYDVETVVNAFKTVGINASGC